MDIKRQIKIWKYIGLTFPFTTLATVIAFHFFGWEDNLTNFFSTILIGFVSVAVFWWWWTLEHMLRLVNALRESENKFKGLLGIINKFKKDLPRQE